MAVFPSSEITLCGNAYCVHALTIETLAKIYDVAQAKDAHPVRQNAAIVAAALAQDHASERLDETLRPNLVELGAAATAILRLSGLVAGEEATSGNAKAPNGA